MPKEKSIREEFDELRNELLTGDAPIPSMRITLADVNDKVAKIWAKIFGKGGSAADQLTASDTIRDANLYSFAEGVEPNVDATGAFMAGYPIEFPNGVNSNMGTVRDGVLTFGADTDGNVRAGSDATAAATTAWIVFSVDQTYNSESMGAGDMLLGDNSSGKANVLWDVSAGQLKFRGGTTTYAYIDTDGTLVTTDALIGGWVVDATSIKDAAGVVGLSSAVTAGDDIRFWAGDATPGNAEFRVTESGALTASNATITGSVTATSGDIAGWTIDADEIKKLTANVGITLDSATPIIKVGDTAGNHLQVDGANNRIRSSNFSAGAAGFNIDGATGDVEVNKILARGVMQTGVMLNTAVGETLLVLPSDSLASDMTAADNSALVLDGRITLAVGDILWLKDETNEEWMEVTNIGSAPSYTVTRDKAAAYGADSKPAWKAGQAVVNYMQSGDGGIKIESGATPKVSCFTHAGSPWSAITEQAYMSETGVKAGAGAVTLDADGITITNGVADINKIKWGSKYIYGLTDATETGFEALWIDVDENYSNTRILLKSSSFGSTKGVIHLDALTETIINYYSRDSDTIIKGDTGTIATFDAGTLKTTLGGELEVTGTVTATSFAWGGWNLRSETWTRTGNHTFTVSGDVTATYRKGTKVRYKDGGSFEYGVVISSSYSAPDTTITLAANNDYAMAAATITDTAISFIENPDGYPDTFNYTPTITSSAGAISSVSVATAKFTISATRLKFWHDFTCDLGSATALEIRASLPATPAFVSAFVASTRDASSGTVPLGIGLVYAAVGSAYRLANGSNWSVGATKRMYGNGEIPF